MDLYPRHTKWFSAFCMSILATSMLAGCMSKPAAKPPEPSPSLSPAASANVKKTLKITYPSDQQFKKEYGDSFKKSHPNIDIQVIPTNQTVGGKTIGIEYAKILEQKPDLVWGSNLVREANKSGKLMELTPLLNQDKIDLNQFSAVAIDALKSLGDGKLPYILSIRNDALKIRDGHKLDPFYAHRPFPPSPTALLPQEINQQVNNIMNEELADTLYGRKSVDDALQSAQTRVQQVIDQ